METLTNCPICNHDKFKSFLSCMDYTVSHETFQIIQCEVCGFRFTNPRPDEREISEYYQSGKYISHSDINKGIVNKIYQVVRKYTLKQKVKLINRLSANCWRPLALPTANLLDFGCGTGEFLNACKQNGWNVTGIEPSDVARKHAKEKFGFSFSPSMQALSPFPVRRTPYGEGTPLRKGREEGGLGFNVITLWHVLEHIHQLGKTIEQFRNILCDGGVLIVAVPNCNSYDAKKYGEHWAAWDLPRHLYHFTKKDIETLMKKHGFELSEIFSMKFDSYYISLLSEKYKTGHTKLFKGFFNGFISNLYAGNNDRGYSSQIYILRPDPTKGR